MNTYSFSHLGDDALRRELPASAARERGATVVVLAQIAEYDARKLYLPDGYPSMLDYCVRELRMSRPAALKRIRVARLAREYPAIFPAIAEGRLHLSSVIQLSPCLTSENADELLAAAAGKTEFEVAELLVKRFPRLDAPDLAMALAPSQPIENTRSEVSARRLVPAKVTPVAEDRYAVQFTWGKNGHEKLQRAQDLLSHSIPSRAIAEVVERALELLIAQAEKRKFAATSKPRRSRSGANPRHIPADVKRQVRERDGDQCTFVSDSGRRCEARARLEFDHVEEVARGGQSSVSNLRLRCRAHNQYTAERTYGAGFMERKREEAAERAAEKTRATAVAEPPRADDAQAAAEAAAAAERVRELTVAMRSLGYRADQAKAAAAYGNSIPDAPLEVRIRRALSYFRPKGRTYDASGVEKVWGAPA